MEGELTDTTLVMSRDLTVNEDGTSVIPLTLMSAREQRCEESLSS